MTFGVVLAVAMAGAFGATLRYLLQHLLRQWFEATPGPIAVINVLGCFGFGVCLACAQGRWSPAVQVAVLTGFFGAFTTFSAFAFDNLELWNARRLGPLLLNVVAQNVLGMLALWLGTLVVPART